MGNSQSYNDEFIKYCIKDDIISAQRLISKKKIDINYNNNEAFNKACINNSLIIVDWLSSLNNINLNKKELKIILKKNYLNIIIILYKRDMLKIDNKFFILSCRYSLFISKWIYENNNNIDIHFNDEKALLNSLLTNNLYISKWLLSLDANLEINDDYIFKKICEYNFFNIEKKKIILDFLCSQCERYNYDNNNSIFIPIIEDIIYYYIKKKLWNELIKEAQIIKIDNFIAKECSITLNDSNMIINCNHHFDFINLMKWYLIKNKCPICNKTIILNKCYINKDIIL